MVVYNPHKELHKHSEINIAAESGARKRFRKGYTRYYNLGVSTNYFQIEIFLTMLFNELISVNLRESLVNKRLREKCTCNVYRRWTRDKFIEAKKKWVESNTKKLSTILKTVNSTLDISSFCVGWDIPYALAQRVATVYALQNQLSCIHIRQD